MSHHARRLSRLLITVPLIAGAVSPAAGHAATVPAHLVSQAQAAAALPAGTAMPGKPFKNWTTTDSSFLTVTPCVGPKAAPVTLQAAHPITRFFGGSSTGLELIVTAVVFHTTAAAGVGLAAVQHSEAHCPSHQTASDGSASRTLTQKYGFDGWAGWRSIDHLNFPADPSVGDPAYSVRLNTEFLVRGNVLLELSEIGDLSAGSGPLQDDARRKATTAMLAGFAKL